MSAPQIPNLNTLRRGGGGRGRVLRGRGGAGVNNDDGNHHHTGSAAKDRVVQGTDNDASVSRLSAVELGYLDDPFARVLTPSTGPGTRRFPIINRDKGDPFHASLAEGATYREALWREGEGEDDVTISAEGDALHSPFYHIHPIDLRSLAKPPAADSQSHTSSDSPSDPEHTSSQGNAPSVLLPGVDTSLPTLLLSECCLVYLSPEDAAGVVDYFTKTLFPRPAAGSDAVTPLGLILYEPIRPDDPFGKTMVSNLAARGIQLQTLHRYASLDAQRQRLRDHGFDAGQGAADVDLIWEHWVSDAEKERVARLEMLDEMEEWKLLAQHYCVAWGWREGTGTAAGAFDRWKDVQAQSTS
ncbi:Leucine carboxyl methyltransferase 1 [Rasamsonia emersonii CBS 393.64]|uniref:Leucine carboxyl methyltransferase 1 n=1 Tax=Rasamsonia emersonii (strain ATCC 16479 / CBS 393.64 / IMI 116815) TaxID=1408163 RepID=A0A0F4YQT0_RASE3|nr:Leucine carboxyl methyltransferase 1 [Rasamsonia emersonii CBS 393.64]KKA20186.1 Leucine carboxyl methyltransferase 1 [Rasamsonia emersonii CBS 393.64]